jgi:hypothetical protein
MKQSLTLCALLTLSGLHAQVSIDYSDLSATGVALDMYIVTDPGTSSPPSDGINQTWDVSSVTVQPLGTLNFTAAANTPFAANYPTANWAWAQTVTGVGTDHIYLNIGTTGIEVLATDVPSSTNNYTDPKRIMQFPMTYGQNFTDTYADMDGPGTVTWSYTGHGTLITPLGSIPDLAKVVSTEDDLLLWNTTPLYPVVIDDGTAVLFFTPSDVGIGDLNAGSAVQVYPNPCTDRLVVDGPERSAWRITDLQGRVLETGVFNSTGLQSLDASGLASGAYVLTMGTPAGQRSIRFCKQ